MAPGSSARESFDETELGALPHEEAFSLVFDEKLQKASDPHRHQFLGSRLCDEKNRTICSDASGPLGSV